MRNRKIRTANKCCEPSGLLESLVTATVEAIKELFFLAVNHIRVAFQPFECEFLGKFDFNAAAFGSAESPKPVRQRVACQKATMRKGTTRQILIYSALLAPISVLPWLLGFAGAIYGATAVVCGGIFVGTALQLDRSSKADRKAAHRLFAFSIAYLFLLFAALLISSISNGRSPTASWRAASACSEIAQAGVFPNRIQTACNFTSVRADGA